MDYTLSGKLTVFADEEILDGINEAFTEGSEEEDKDYSDIMGEVYEDDIELNEDSIIIPFEQTYEILRGFDYSKSVVAFMKKFLSDFTGIEKASFEGRYETWDNNTFMNFLCKCENSEITIYESDNYNEFSVDEESSYEEILEEFGWDENQVSEKTIDKFRGKSIYVLETIIYNEKFSGENDILEVVPTDYLRKDLTTKI